MTDIPTEDITASPPDTGSDPQEPRALVSSTDVCERTSGSIRTNQLLDPLHVSLLNHGQPEGARRYYLCAYRPGRILKCLGHKCRDHSWPESVPNVDGEASSSLMIRTDQPPA